MNQPQARNPSEPQLATQLAHELYTRFHLVVSQTWLDSFLSTVRKPPPPLPALTSTAHFRLLNSDLTQSLFNSSSSTPSVSLPTLTEPLLLPHNIVDVNVKETQLRVNVPVQVLDIKDVGSSKWSQIEVIERFERGEEVKGREVIRTLPTSDEQGDGAEPGARNCSDGGTGFVQSVGASKRSTGPHRLLLQDAAGTKVWGFESETVPKVYITNTAEEGGLQVGTKVLLKQGIDVRRGLIMLEPTHVAILGGKVEAWDKKWKLNRKQQLTDDLKKENEVTEAAG